MFFSVWDCSNIMISHFLECPWAVDVPLKVFVRISVGSYALLESFCSLFEGSFVSDIIRISTCVLLVSSASSARLPFMLLALRVPIRRCFVMLSMFWIY